MVHSTQTNTPIGWNGTQHTDQYSNRLEWYTAHRPILQLAGMAHSTQTNTPIGWNGTQHTDQYSNRLEWYTAHRPILHYPHIQEHLIHSNKKHCSISLIPVPAFHFTESPCQDNIWIDCICRSICMDGWSNGMYMYIPSPQLALEM